MDIALIILAGFCMIAALIGCVAPVLPGPALGFVGILLTHFTQKFEFSLKELIVYGVITVVAVVLDYIVPAMCTKQFGGSKWGVWGSILGLVVGLVAPIPFGVIIGPFAGAVIGELLAGKENKEALKSGLGSFIGFILSTGLKLAVVIAFCVVYVKEIWGGYFA